MTKRKLSTSQWDSSEESSDYEDVPRKRLNKPVIRLKLRVKAEHRGEELLEDSLEARARRWTPLSAIEDELGPESFEEVIEDMLVSLIEARAEMLRGQIEINHLNQKLRPLTIAEENYFLSELLHDSSTKPNGPSIIERILIRKLELQKHRRKHDLPSPRFDMLVLPEVIRIPDIPPPAPSQPLPDASVLNSLLSIGTTPFSCSFAARVAGKVTPAVGVGDGSGVIPILGFGFGPAPRRFLHRDWETRAPWMDLMDDIHEHHALMHPERIQTSRPTAPIDYEPFREQHTTQVHDLLWRTFWPGIDIRDALQYSPEQCTVVATYRHLVVGAAFLSSPQETYITFLVVRAGWEGAQIATKMLYSLIERNPGRDILLHVSANNPAMLLYNRFGFKAEEFIVGFYEDYLDAESRASKNAFRLRLRA